jgi:hypothetical protein
VRDPVTDLSGTYEKKAKEILVRWKYSTRRNEKYWFVVYRSENQSPLMEYSSTKGTIREFRDPRVKTSATYRYSIRVMADGGAQSSLSDTTEVSVAGTENKNVNEGGK